MTKHYLLLGAGFSRNWGGWLASEAFEYLLGSPELLNDRGVIQLLWRHKFTGGFEAALAELQDHTVSGGSEVDVPLQRLQAAVSSMFRDMNKAFETVNFEMANPPQIGTRVVDFLNKFDAIFTLNQDLLLEKHYVSNVGMQRGIYLPGITEIITESMVRLCDRKWSVGTLSKQSPGLQPLYKLHGSSNWIDEFNRELLVIGGNKSQFINKIGLLSEYRKIFADSLRSSDARLMVIGYGFGDDHINSIISGGAAEGLRLFIMDPLGTDVYNKTRGGAVRQGDPLDQSIIGASRRTLREVFGGDRIEHAKIMRFFA